MEVRRRVSATTHVCNPGWHEDQIEERGVVSVAPLDDLVWMQLCSGAVNEDHRWHANAVGHGPPDVIDLRVSYLVSRIDYLLRTIDVLGIDPLKIPTPQLWAGMVDLLQDLP